MSGGGAKDRAPAPIRWQRVVRLIHRGVLGRSPDAAEVEAAVGRLRSGEVGLDSWLAELVDGDEAKARRALVDGWTWESDRRFEPWRKPEIQACSERLERERPLDRAAFDALWHQRFEVELGHGPAEQPLQEYGAMHRERFWETANAIALLLEGRAQPRLLDFGISVFSWFYRRLFPDVELVTVDRPLAGPAGEFFAQHSRDVGASRHVTIDLEDPKTWTDEVRAELGRFDVVLFTEVIEHLLVHPVEVLTPVVGCLQDDGALYLTTPNFFRQSVLGGIVRRVNPQEVYPRSDKRRTAMHQREFELSELLGFLAEAGAAIRGFYYSSCWDQTPIEPPDRRSNLVVVAGRASAGATQG